jgi:dinuclear metal center YbgI/SA1388 family protein
MPARLADIVQELDRLLEPAHFQDYGPNGLQVPGQQEVATVATGVTAHLELFERARAEDAQLVLVHHGLFWGTGPGPIDAALARRLRVLFEADIALLAYHLPLDAHPEVGNNALLARALGGERLEPFAPHRGQPIGCLASLSGTDRTPRDEGVVPRDKIEDLPREDSDLLMAGEGDGSLVEDPGLPAEELFDRVRTVTAREPLVFDFGPPLVRRLAIVTGAGADHLADAIAAGADAFLTGEPAERVMAQAREAGLHFIAAGHYATETFGVRRLGEHLRERFDLRHVFLDFPNPI